MDRKGPVARADLALSDVERLTQERSAQFKAARDSHFRLVCGAAVSATRNAFGNLDRERILNHRRLVERDTDAVAVSTAHGHSKGVGDMVRVCICAVVSEIAIIAGNVTNAAGVVTWRI